MARGNADAILYGEMPPPAHPKQLIRSTRPGTYGELERLGIGHAEVSYSGHGSQIEIRDLDFYRSSGAACTANILSRESGVDLGLLDKLLITFISKSLSRHAPDWAHGTFSGEVTIAVEGNRAALDHTYDDGTEDFFDVLGED